MTYNPQWVDNSVLDPTKFGNWVLVEEYNLSSESLDETITWDGEQNPKIRIECDGDFEVIGLQINGDTASNYLESRMNVDGSSIDGSQTARTAIFCTGATGEEVFTITEGNFKNNGFGRCFINQTSRYVSTNTDANLQMKGLVWDNDTDDVTSIRLYSVNGSSNVGNVKIYRWQDIVPVEIHSLELVAEYDLSAEGLDETITWDGEQDDYIRIEANGDFDTIKMQINGDSGNNYEEGRNGQDGNSANLGSNTRDGVLLSSASGNISFSIMEGNFKNRGQNRIFNNIINKYSSGNTDSIQNIRGTYWSNSADDVTSITIVDGSAGAGSSTGNIKVYRRAKTSILSTAPDALHGLEQASADATGQVTVGPGSVEIKGKNLHLQSQTTINVYDNLRSGDSISGGEYVYLYAYDSNNSVGLEYSTSSPTKDRYGNIVTLNSDVDYTKGLYHPNDASRRYIGQVYINNDLTMRDFDICRPGYCKGSWTPVAADADSGGNTSTTGTGKYIKTGSSVKVWGEIEDVNTTPLTGTNQFNIQGLPYQSDGNAVGSIGLNGVNDPANDGFGITSEIRDTNSAIRIRITKDLGGDIVQVQDITDDNNLFIFQLDYITSEF